jgi:hypothetical protein
MPFHSSEEDYLQILVLFDVHAPLQQLVCYLHVLKAFELVTDHYVYLGFIYHTPAAVSRLS